ncbi:MAG: hypothetical protein K8S62_08840 [Candidatus Sabulitectum sp.]|nr:hypothetical protein [Candidatus Sabulitectum sp.]
MKAALGLLVMMVFVCWGDTVLSYHDSTPQWLTWGGMYRGTWFHVEDFIPGATDFLVEWVDLWFYQHPSFPWDTNQIFVELWSGDGTGPVEFLAGEQVTALLQPAVTRVYFDPPVETGPDFWCLLNTEFSAGGWPSVLLDGTPSEHSFYSDDFIVWEPHSLGDYFISVGNDTESLQRTSWGALKTTF